MKLKLGRKEVELTKGDWIMDNGACLQIETKNKDAEVWPGWSGVNPYLSKKEFSRFLKEAVFETRKELIRGLTITIHTFISDKLGEENDNK